MGNVNTLLLSAGEEEAALFDDGVVSVMVCSENRSRWPWVRLADEVHLLIHPLLPLGAKFK